MPVSSEQAPPPEPSAADLSPQRGRRLRRWQVLFAAGLVIALALLTYAFWPWLLPTFIYEGPLVQRAGQRELTLVWYLSRPTGEAPVVRLTEPSREVPVEVSGRRCRAVLGDLAPDTSYGYQILLGERRLAEHAFRTSKPAGAAFNFVVFGDSGTGGREQYELAGLMVGVEPDFLLHTGDVVYPTGARTDYRERFFLPYRALLATVGFWPSLGNHDLAAEPGEDPGYFEVFELPENGPPGLPPEHNYWFDYATARIVVVDSNLEEARLGADVAPWLGQVLADPTPRWKFVVFHHPPYTGGKYAPDERIQRTLVPVFEQTGVDVVFSGHDHLYQRTFPIRQGQVATDGDGVVYVISGAGGARLYEPLPPERRPAYVAALHHEVHSFTHVRVAGDELTLEQIAIDGSVLDRWSLRKPTAADGSP